MSDPGYERLYKLLPAIYRQRDLQQGQQLRALMAVLQDQLLTLQSDIESLYDNWFIETADDWVVPYIADLVGITDLSEARNSAFSQRRRVANAIAYRRRKGTTATLEHVLHDVTDWSVRVLDYSTLLGLTQHIAHLRPQNGRLGDIRKASFDSPVGGPFETTAHLADVRNSSNNPSQADRVGGRYRPDHLGIFIWRLKSYPVSLSPAKAILNDAGRRKLPLGCYTFDPLGRDLPLFIQPDEIKQISDRTTPVTIAGPLSRTQLAQDLANFTSRTGGVTAQNLSLNSTYYGPDRSLFVVEKGTAILPGAVISADLSHWKLPPKLRERASGITAAIDPVLGRLALRHNRRQAGLREIEVSYNYGFSDDLGGGPYPRSDTLKQPLKKTFEIEMAQGGRVDSLAKALADWEKVSKDQPRCILTIVDSGVYASESLAISLPKNSQLVIQAADGMRPVLQAEGVLTVENKPGGASLVLNGLWIDGRFELASPINLTISHCTLMPQGLVASPKAARGPAMEALQVAIDHSVIGPIQLPEGGLGLAVANSILDGGSGFAIIGPNKGAVGPVLELQNVTIFGKVNVRRILQASGVIFDGPVQVEDTHAGLVSFSYIPPDSHTPRRESCQPRAADKSGHTGIAGERLSPRFSSTRFGDPAYAQLNPDCPAQIRRGAPDGGEMGAFHDLFLVQRQDNLNAILDEFMPFGLEAGIFFVT